MTRQCQSVNHEGDRYSDETFECPYCRKIYCALCEGVASEDDPFEDSCDDCWYAMTTIYGQMNRVVNR